ncbi:glycosyltransferase family 4 protein [Solirubrobacter sp. CPCC 204708]|nr:glycosyltransferase family 4 protein [Solirubrobacter deserti]
MQNHTGQLTRALAARGVRQTVVTGRPPGAPRRDAPSPGVVVLRHGLRLRAARQLYCVGAARSAWRHAPGLDLVHAHVGEDLAVLPLARMAAERAGAPLVITVHTSLHHTFVAAGLRARALKAVGGRIEDWAERHCAQVIGLTPRLAERLIDGGVAAERVRVIPSGVVPAEFAGDVADPFPQVPRPRALFVGRLHRQKGIETLIQAAAALRGPLVVVGDGPERAAAEAAVRAAGIGDRVYFAGFRPHHAIGAIMRHADVLVVPSVYEELGTVVLEGMQAGLPIVASDTGGIPGALGDAGVLVAPGDPVAFAAGVNRVLEDRDEAERLGALARERARAYGWDGLAERVLEVYDAALGFEPTAAELVAVA